MTRSSFQSSTALLLAVALGAAIAAPAAAGAASAAPKREIAMSRFTFASYSSQTWIRSPSLPSTVRISAGPVLRRASQKLRAS